MVDCAAPHSKSNCLHWETPLRIHTAHSITHPATLHTLSPKKACTGDDVADTRHTLSHTLSLRTAARHPWHRSGGAEQVWRTV